MRACNGLIWLSIMTNVVNCCELAMNRRVA